MPSFDIKLPGRFTPQQAADLAEIQQRLSQAKLLDKGLDNKLAGAHPAAATGGGVGSLGR